jgi:glycosyltransferase involved in cell wall biosynthesis
MRILALTNLYPNPYQPHRAPFNRHQLRLLAARHAVRVISPIAWTDELAARRRGMAPLRRDRPTSCDGLTVDHPRYFFTPRVGRGWYGHFYLASVWRTFRRVAAEFRPDLVFAPWAYPDGWAAVQLARRLGRPAVLQVHGSDVLQLGRFPARRRRTVAATRAADGVVAVSEDLASHLTAFGVAPERIRVIYDGVDRSLFCPGSQADARTRVGLAAGEPVVLFIGNLVPVKAVDVLIEACARLAAEKSPVRLVVIGQGPLRSDLEALARTRGIGGRVRFLGALPQSSLPDWYRAADVFALPSHSEGVPNVLLEASAAGTPWVASAVGGIPEIARLGRSRLAPPNAPAAVARAIRETLAGPELPPSTGPRSRQEAVLELEQFLWQCSVRAPAAVAAPVLLGTV